jgi:hypothetical protein
MDVIGRQNQFPIHQIPQARGHVRSFRFVYPPAKWLLQGHLWSEQISEFQAQGCRQFFSFHLALPAVKIAFVPRRFHPATEQESPQRMHDLAGNGLGRMRADLLQLGGLAFVWAITEVA